MKKGGRRRARFVRGGVTFPGNQVQGARYAFINSHVVADGHGSPQAAAESDRSGIVNWSGGHKVIDRATARCCIIFPCQEVICRIASVTDPKSFIVESCDSAARSETRFKNHIAVLVHTAIGGAQKVTEYRSAILCVG